MISGTAVNSRWIMWMIAGWSGLHVQPHCWDRSPNHAKGVCNCRVARQPRSPDVPGLYEVGCECVSQGTGGLVRWSRRSAEVYAAFPSYPVSLLFEP